MSVYVEYSDSETTIPDGVSLDDFSDSDYMSVHSVDLGGAGTDPEDTHEHKIKDKFHCHIEWVANVHAPISIPQAMKIPKAKAALDKEWNKLESKRTWLTETVRAKKDVIDEYKRKGKRAHFGSLMDSVSYTHLTLPTILRV